MNKNEIIRKQAEFIAHHDWSAQLKIVYTHPTSPESGKKLIKELKPYLIKDGSIITYFGVTEYFHGHTCIESSILINSIKPKNTIDYWDDFWRPGYISMKAALYEKAEGERLRKLFINGENIECFMSTAFLQEDFPIPF